MNKVAIIGREEELSGHIFYELKATYQEYEVKAIPLVISEGTPFELPYSKRQQMFLFTSPRAVDHFLEQHNIPEGSEVASLGHRTTRALCRHGIEPDMTARFESSAIVMPKLINYLRYTASNYQMVLPTYGDGYHHYGDALRESGIDFITLQVYKVLAHPDLKDNLAKIETKPEWVLFYSPISVQAWSEATNWRPISFGVDHATAEELKRHGFTEVYESPSPHHYDILDTIIKYQSPFKLSL